MASMLVSGNEMLHANSDKHWIISWKESISSIKWMGKTSAKKSSVYEIPKILDWLIMNEVVLKAPSTMLCRFSPAALVNRENTFFQPERILSAWDCTWNFWFVCFKIKILASDLFAFKLKYLFLFDVSHVIFVFYSFFKFQNCHLYKKLMHI